MSRDPQLDRLRVTNQQRDNAVTALRQAVADGRLAFEEFEARMPVALHAQSRGDLVGILDDLVEPADLDRAIADPQVMGDGPGFSWENPLIITSEKHDRKRLGPWDVPPFLEVHPNAWGILLDFTMARPLAPVIDLVVASGMMGTLTVIVPDDWGVDTGGINSHGQAQINSQVRTRPVPGKPRIIISGQTSGTLSVRRATSWDQRRLQRHLRRHQLALPPS